MKKIYIFFLVFLSFNLIAQNRIFPESSFLKFDEYGRPMAIKQMKNIADVNKQKLDSICYSTSGENSNPKNIIKDFSYKYDENGHFIEKIEWSNTGIGLIPYTKFEYNWDSDGNPVSEKIFDYIGVNINGNYSLELERTYQYNSNGLLIEMTEMGGYEGKDLPNEFKIEYAYENDQLLTEISSYWSNSQENWYKSQKTEYAYSGGLLLQKLEFEFNNEQWEYAGKIIFNYDDNQLISELALHSNDSIYSQTNYNYDENNNIILIEYFDLIEDSNALILNRMTEYIYNEENKVLFEKRYKRNSNTGAFESASERTQEFSENNDLIYSEYTDFEIFASNSATSIEYNSQYSFNDLILPKITFQNEDAHIYQRESGEFNSFTFNHARTKKDFYHWNNNDEIFEYEQTTLYYYSPLEISSVNEIANIGSYIYPIPAKEVIHISNFEISDQATLKIYNMQGKLLHTKELTNSKVTLSHLPTGIYIYELSNGRNQKTGKLVFE